LYIQPILLSYYGTCIEQFIDGGEGSENADVASTMIKALKISIVRIRRQLSMYPKGKEKKKKEKLTADSILTVSSRLDAWHT
jgi:hypothetical protein